MAVITGIAEGIDTAAAMGALKAGGRVVAVPNGARHSLSCLELKTTEHHCKGGCRRFRVSAGYKGLKDELPHAQQDNQRSLAWGSHSAGT